MVEEPRIAILMEGRVGYLRELAGVLAGAGVHAEVVRPPDARLDS